MNLTLDDESRQVASEAGRAWRQHLPVARLRMAPGSGVWAELASLGWASLGAVRVGGTLDLGTIAAVYREAGRQILIEPLVTSGYLLAALAERAAGDRAGLAARLAAGPGILLGDGRDFDYEVGPLVSGFCFGVDYPESDLYRLNRDPAGQLVLEFASGQDSAWTRRLASELSLSVGYVSVERAQWSSVPLNLDDQSLGVLWLEAILMHSAALLGCAEHMLRMVVSHTGSRVQFNVPVGGFQAVKHGVADAHVRNEVAWSAVLHACAASSSEFGYRAKIARFLAVEAALQSSRAAAQFFGGMGFTWESDLHFYLKAVLDATQRFGAADQLAARIGRQFMEVSC